MGKRASGPPGEQGLSGVSCRGSGRDTRCKVSHSTMIDWRLTAPSFPFFINSTDDGSGGGGEGGGDGGGGDGGGGDGGDGSESEAGGGGEGEVGGEVEGGSGEGWK